MDEPKFELGEKVIVNYGQKWYRAKTLQFKLDEANDKIYYLHFFGYPESMDEWIGENLIMEDNAENKAKMLELAAALRKPRGKKRSKAATPKKKETKAKKPAKGKTPPKTKPAPKEKKPKAASKSRKRKKSVEEVVDEVEELEEPEPPAKKRTRSSSSKTPKRGRGRPKSKTLNDKKEDDAVPIKKRRVADIPVEPPVPSENVLEEPVVEENEDVQHVQENEDVQHVEENEDVQYVEEKGDVQFVGEKVSTPASIVEWLKLDHKYIETGLLVKIPCRPTVAETIDLYLCYQKEHASAEGYALSSLFGKFFVDIFDRYYAKVMYETEEEQCRTFRDHFPDQRPSEIYGAHHLIRLGMIMTPLELWPMPDHVKINEDFFMYLNNFIVPLLGERDYGS